MPHPLSKPDYRYKYIKGFLGAYLFISWGTMVALITFADNNQPLVGKSKFEIALISLGTILFFHLIILFFNFIGAGAHWDYLNSDSADDEASSFTSSIGSIIRFFLITSFLVLFPVALISSLWFVLLNT